MPVKWSADKDQLILNIIFTDPTININVGQVAKAVVAHWRK